MPADWFLDCHFTMFLLHTWCLECRSTTWFGRAWCLECCFTGGAWQMWWPGRNLTQCFQQMWCLRCDFGIYLRNVMSGMSFHAMFSKMVSGESIQNGCPTCCKWVPYVMCLRHMISGITWHLAENDWCQKKTCPVCVFDMCHVCVVVLP